MKERLALHLGPLLERFDGLAGREKYALVFLGVSTAMLTLYLAVWAPLDTYVQERGNDHDRHLALLQYFESTQAEARAAAASDGQPRGAGQALLSEVSRSVRTVGISPSRMQTEGTDAVSVWYDEVVFTRLMLWLERLEIERGIVVRQISVERRDQPGTVSARLVLRR